MKIVVVSPMQPYEAIGNAGGQLLHRHLVALSATHDVTLLVAGDPWHGYSDDVARQASYRTLQLPPRSEAPLRAAVSTVLRRVFPVEVLRGLWSSLGESPEAARLLREADLVELQWFEALVTAPELRRAGVGAPVSGFFHDVVSQRGSRRFAAQRGWKKAVLGVRLAHVRWLERRLLRRTDRAVCLSEKDARLLVAAGAPERRVHVVRPPLVEPVMPERLPDPADLAGRAPSALFVSDFGRDDNEDAALWLLREVWPRVVSQVPGASLVLAGGGVTPVLAEAVRQVPSASTTGYVESLDAQYLGCRVALSPLHSGAGVKFKSVVPLLWGVPVVSTTIGAEGIPPEWFAAIADDAEGFADAVARVLLDPGSCEQARAGAFAAARAVCSVEAHAHRVQEVYTR